jgi:hypothetical protein
MSATSAVDDNPNMGWIAGLTVIMVILAVMGSFWIYYH